MTDISRTEVSGILTDGVDAVDVVLDVVLDGRDISTKENVRTPLTR